MRYLKLEHIIIEGDIDLPYRKTLLDILRAPQNPQAGIGIDEMRKACRVMDFIEAKMDGEVVALEDADHQYLCERVKSYRWLIAHREIIKLIEAVEQAGSEAPPHLAEAQPIPRMGGSVPRTAAD